MSTLKVNTIQNISGGSSSTPEQIDQGRAKAWMNMNAEPAESIRDSYNVSSFTDNGTGDFVVNFASALATATAGYEVLGGSSVTDASNDITSPMPGFLKLDEIPHMIHFDNVDYYSYDDFSAPVKLNTGNTMNASSETSLIGEFRIDENATSDFHCESLTKYLQEGISKFVPKIKFKEKTNYVPWDNASIRRLLIKKNKTYKCFRAQSNQFKALRPDDQNYYAVFTRVSQKYQKFRDASKSYKTASRREKNRYFNGLKSVWSNPNIPPRKKFSILKKLSKTEKNNFIPPLIENNQTIHDSKNKAEI